MNAQKHLEQILSILHSVKEDPVKLQRILEFLMDEIYVENEEEVIEVPEKFRNVVAEIAENMNAGLVSFLNPDTVELEELIKMGYEDPEDFEMNTGESIESLGLKYPDWKHCIIFEPLESHDAFKIMDAFAEGMADQKFRERLIDALNRRRPFANFRNLVDNSEYRQDWFDFKKKWLEIYVKEQLIMELEQMDDEESE